MLRKAILTTALVLGAALPAVAEEASADRPIVAASLHDGPLDMVAYYTQTETGAFKVVATFRTRNDASPARIVMVLEDGDSVRFSMPGYTQALYGFSREGDRLTVSVESVCGKGGGPCA